jgi:hypothetical protein
MEGQIETVEEQNEEKSLSSSHEYEVF